MKFEINSMSENQVWDLVNPPEGIVPIRNKWVFKRKIGADGKVETYKAMLVAKGYRQRQGVDYEETFSPVAMLKSIRIMLALPRTMIMRFGRWMSRPPSLMDTLRETYLWTNPGVLNPRISLRCANLRDPFMVLSRLRGVGIDVLIRL
ncbi:hypothetical protein CRG98_040215 [Punica granatum]|uniref:Reverse transcriptase Ty1/copia-type domain-containing protein n=1 Tax=Punica granatum TaxID=22663 RepID=A0A2I0I5R9_PUNGR|nr:hypothetical protein CRG98_040215 [Punica granatum]